MVTAPTIRHLVMVGCLTNLREAEKERMSRVSWTFALSRKEPRLDHDLDSSNLAYHLRDRV